MTQEDRLEMDETISAAVTGSVVSGPGGRYPLAGAAQDGQECPVLGADFGRAQQRQGDQSDFVKIA